MPSKGSAVLSNIAATLVDEPMPVSNKPYIRCTVCDTTYRGSTYDALVTADRPQKCPTCNSQLLVSGEFHNGACLYGKPGCPIQQGYCHCGCGKKTETYTKSSPGRGMVLGAAKRFAQGHLPPANSDWLWPHGSNGQAKESIVPTKPASAPRKQLPQQTIAPDSIPGRVLEYLRQQRAGSWVVRYDIAVELELTPKQVTNAIYTLMNAGEPVESDYGKYRYTDEPNTETDNTVSTLMATEQKMSSSQRASKQAVILYELMSKSQNPSGGVLRRPLDIVREKKHPVFCVRGVVSPKLVDEAYHELRQLGCVTGGTISNRLKFLTRHPLEVENEIVPAQPQAQTEPTLPSVRRGRPPKTPERMAMIETMVFGGAADDDETAAPTLADRINPNRPDVVAEVDPADLANAVARAMWDRYEWALAEIGRLQEVVAVQRNQLDRLETIVSQLPLNTVEDIARRFLADAATTN